MGWCYLYKLCIEDDFYKKTGHTFNGRLFVVFGNRVLLYSWPTWNLLRRLYCTVLYWSFGSLFSLPQVLWLQGWGHFSLALTQLTSWCPFEALSLRPLFQRLRTEKPAVRAQRQWKRKEADCHSGSYCSWAQTRQTDSLSKTLHWQNKELSVASGLPVKPGAVFSFLLRCHGVLIQNENRDGRQLS